MKHMNYKLQRLLHEGFSMGTLEKLSIGQLNLLYGKIMEQAGVLNVKKGSDDENKAKASGKAFVTYEEELEEDMEDPMDFEMGKRTQSPKQVGPGTDDGQDSYGDGMPTESEIYEKAVSVGISYSVVKVSKTSITCVKGMLTKKITAVNPKCPSGYKKK